ncbi:hypothetical protein NTJ56_05675 [Burkholderia contaminans]|uniref:hypothetical protein n=1 Tax=Burkholderia contaminans TaxID=488447 RepID=UPI001CF20D6F|nr:hypothetical protein [Burkholderia contaminans]MCA7918458.1 hypothetical protein [Burkholderia contaminans]UUX38301.1 hypothetical protein NTJ56_05675 [Burkholderia contaminans]
MSEPADSGIISTVTNTVESTQSVGYVESPEYFGQVANVDHLIRISTDLKTHSLTAQVWETKEIAAKFNRLIAERAHELKLVVDFAAWQKRKIDYDGIYQAFLLDAITDDQFMEESERFAVEIAKRDPRFIAEAADKLAELLPFELSASDLAEFFSCEQRDVLAAIASKWSHSKKLKELLPDNLLHGEGA